MKQNKLELVANKHKILEEISKQLKLEFFGIDTIIDELILAFTTWYIFTDSDIVGDVNIFKKPTIINLFGLTGTGKTALVNRLLELSNMLDNTMTVDLSKSTFAGSNIVQWAEYNRPSSSGRMVVIIDEIQHARTIAENGSEKEQLVELWSMLDTGSLNIRQYGSSHQFIRLITFIDMCIDNGITINNNKLTQSAINKLKTLALDNLYRSQGRSLNRYIEQIDDEDNSIDSTESVENTVKCIDCPDDDYYNPKPDIGKPFITEEMISDFVSENQNAFQKRQLCADVVMDNIHKCETITDLKEYVMSVSYKMWKSASTFNMQQSLIFVIGNIDEAYVGVADTDPNIDLDMFLEANRDVDLVSIKKTLNYRFRAEQIARLGNTFLLYPPISSVAMKQIISRNIDRICLDITKNFESLGINSEIFINHTINDLIFEEGVCPAHGARPVIEMTTNILMSIMPKIVAKVFENDLLNKDTCHIGYSSKTNSFNICIYNECDGLPIPTLIIPNTFNKLTKKRELVFNDCASVYAVHEVGHILANLYYFGIYPETLTIHPIDETKNPGVLYRSDEQNRLMSYDYILKHCKAKLAGKAAELLVFGCNNISSGYISDMREVTDTLLMFEKTNNGSIGHERGELSEIDDIHNLRSTSGAVKNQISELYDDVYNFLKQHQSILIGVAHEIIHGGYNGVLNKEQIKKIIATVYKDGHSKIPQDTKLFSYSDKLTEKWRWNSEPGLND